MIKSVESVFENNLIADSMMGDLFMITPYLEPAANSECDYADVCRCLHRPLLRINWLLRHQLYQ